jgi:signal transduction histidine kinase
MAEGQVETSQRVANNQPFSKSGKWRSAIPGYGLGLATTTVTLIVAILLSRYSISVNLTLLVVAAVLIPTWYGGIGPGLMVGIIFEFVSILSKPPTAGASIANYVFGHVSVMALYVFFVLIVRARRKTEKRIKEQSKLLNVLNAELEQRVAERTAELEAANSELEAFSYSVSHDLRAPLRHINGFSMALLEDYSDKLDGVGRDFLKQLREASQEMAHLIDDMLRLAGVTRAEMHREKVDLSELGTGILGELQRAEPDRVLKVTVQKGLLAYGDKRLLGVVLANLLGNAWKFSSRQEDAEVTLGREGETENTCYFVRDNGAGFDMAFADKLYGAFQRLHSVNEFEGTGIGLATVRRIVSRHGGRIWAEGAVGKGATFYFTLPDIKEVENEG